LFINLQQPQMSILTRLSGETEWRVVYETHDNKAGYAGAEAAATKIEPPKPHSSE